MAKQFKKSLVLGKFYPLHKGHLHLINTAIEYSDEVCVMVCYNSKQSIPGKDRADALREIYFLNTDINIILCCDENLPQSDKECVTTSEFYSFWVPFVHKFVNDIDCVFTSENYGDEFANYLGVKHYLVDIDRETINISATQIRENPTEYWDYIPVEMRKRLVKKIALVGPESVGKSVLSARLAEHFHTEYVTEWGRNIFENNGNTIALNDFEQIILGRHFIEDQKLLNSGPILFCDTEDIVTYIFSKLFFPSDYIQIEHIILDMIREDYMYILLKPDCEFVQDGTRQFEEIRDKHYDIIKNELTTREYNFIEIGGNWEERYMSIINYVDSVKLKF
jgi:HTH-type transcriptional regulator, transcriptional repressor of NAD biosynthesis genes